MSPRREFWTPDPTVRCVLFCVYETFANILVTILIPALLLVGWMILRPWLRRRSLERFAESHGWEIDFDPSNDLRSLDPDDQVLGIRSARITVRLRGVYKGMRAEVLEHAYEVLINNRVRHVVHRICLFRIATDRARLRINPRAWHRRATIAARLVCAAKRAVIRPASALGVGSTFDIGPFDRRYVVDAVDLQEASLLLSQNVRMRLARSSVAYWRIFPDVVMMIERGPLSAVNASVMLPALRRVVRNALQEERHDVVHTTPSLTAEYPGDPPLTPAT